MSARWRTAGRWIVLALLTAGAASPEEVTALVGDGKLVAGFDGAGHLSALAWPGPGLHDHITASQPALPRLGAWWALQTQGTVRVVEASQATQRYVEARAPILEEVHRFQESNIVTLQTIFVVPGRDLLVWRLEVLGAADDLRAALFCAASPATRPLPPVPLPAPSLDAANAFATLADRDVRIAFALRPNAPGRRVWERAQTFATESAPPSAWDAFEDGAWLAAGPADAEGGVALSPLEASRQPATLFAPSRRGAAVGPGALVVLPGIHTMQGRAEATVYIALGTNREATADILQSAREQGYQRLYDETLAAWKGRLTVTPLAGAQAVLSPGILERALVTLRLAANADTGAVAFAPMPTNEALVYPRDAGWVALALARAGHAEAGAAHLRFLAAHVRAEEAPGAPYGSMPAYLYTNGEPAAPDAVLDLDAAAWWLSACQRFGQAVPREEEVRLYRAIWPAIMRAGEFIAAWTDPASGALVPTWQTDRMRDGTSVESILTGFMGLLAAEHIAVTLGEDALPEWRPRRRALEAALQFRFVQHAEPWPLDPALLYWLDGVVPPDHWLRKPMRVGTGEWTPLSGATLPAVRETLAPITRPLYFDNTREAAMQLVSAYAEQVLL